MRIFIILLILSFVLFAYPVWRLGEWLQLPTMVNLAITTPLFLSQFIVRFGLRHSRGRLVYAVRGAADFFLGLSPVILLQVLIAEFCLAVFELPTSGVALFILATTAVAGIWGLIKAWRPAIVTVSLSSKKLTRPLRFAQISDVHIGSRTSRFLGKVIDSVNRQAPEFLCITGDFIDQSGVSKEKLQALSKFKGPIYYCTGNHERYEDLEQIISRLESLGVEVLRNRAIETSELQIIGVEDSNAADQVRRVLPFIDVRKDRYSILLYHRPQGLEAAGDHGIDLKLSGHTHNGQVMPFHLAVKRVYEYTQGLYRHGETYLYVNQGTGTWGPTLRLGSQSEITLFEISAE